MLYYRIWELYRDIAMESGAGLLVSFPVLWVL